ncbi:hypothetical protein EDC02_2221 [Micromonospora sp. Llam0]|nr:hypothetical protein EDC02_2221 [Micromonospora sp. Llam0]
MIPEADRIPSIRVAVGRPDGDGWTAGHDLLFPACSISKHVAAFGTLRLFVAAAIAFDIDVNACLSAAGAGTVTVRQLLVRISRSPFVIVCQLRVVIMDAKKHCRVAISDRLGPGQFLSVTLAAAGRRLVTTMSFAYDMVVTP